MLKIKRYANVLLLRFGSPVIEGWFHICSSVNAVRELIIDCQLLNCSIVQLFNCFSLLKQIVQSKADISCHLN